MTRQHLEDNAFNGDVTITKELTLASNVYQADTGYALLGDVEAQGTVVLSQDPATSMEAATKRYVDNMNEVFVGPDDPGAAFELWVDTDAGVPVGPGTAWTDLTMTNGWVADSSAYQKPQIRLIGDVVYLRGQMVKTSATSPMGQYPFSFAAIYNPPKMLRVSGVAFQSTPYLDNCTATARMEILAIGQGFLNEITPLTINPCVSLNGISWSVTP